MDPSDRSRATERRDATVMFADITRFSSLVEPLVGDEEPDEALSSLLKPIGRKGGIGKSRLARSCVPFRGFGGGLG